MEFLIHFHHQPETIMKRVTVTFTEGEIHALAHHFEGRRPHPRDYGSTVQTTDLCGAVDKITEAIRPALGRPAEMLVS